MTAEDTTTTTSPAQPATPAQPAAQPLPPGGGSYLFDEATGVFTLVQRTQDRNEE